jgi:hypothetical protein
MRYTTIHPMVQQESAISIGTRKDSRLTTNFHRCFSKLQAMHALQVPCHAMPKMVAKLEFKTIGVALNLNPLGGTQGVVGVLVQQPCWNIPQF